MAREEFAHGPSPAFRHRGGPVVFARSETGANVAMTPGGTGAPLPAPLPAPAASRAPTAKESLLLVALLRALWRLSYQDMHDWLRAWRP